MYIMYIVCVYDVCFDTKIHKCTCTCMNQSCVSLACTITDPQTHSLLRFLGRALSQEEIERRLMEQMNEKFQITEQLLRQELARKVQCMYIYMYMYVYVYVYIHVHGQYVYSTLALGKETEIANEETA